MTSLRNIKLLLAYDGTGYAGWQRQPDRPTIQGVVEEKLFRMTGERTVIHGAGRTDAGVHALAMTANFLTAAGIPIQGFKRGLNSLLPEDIRVMDAVEEMPDFHARFSAAGKTYFYNITVAEVQLPSSRLYSLHVGKTLDLNVMRISLEFLKGLHDFSGFEAAGSRDPARQEGRGAERRIFAAHLAQNKEESLLRIEIAGDGFLRHMVRNIVGTVIEIGMGKRPAEDVRDILTAGDRSMAGPTAPARGLFLKKVHYRPLGTGNK